MKISGRPGSFGSPAADTPLAGAEECSTMSKLPEPGENVAYPGDGSSYSWTILRENSPGFRSKVRTVSCPSRKEASVILRTPLPAKTSRPFVMPVPTVRDSSSPRWRRGEPAPPPRRGPASRGPARTDRILRTSLVVLSNSRKLKPAFRRALNETDAGPGEGASVPSAAPLTRKRQGFPWRMYWMAIRASDPDFLHRMKRAMFFSAANSPSRTAKPPQTFIRPDSGSMEGWSLSQTNVAGRSREGVRLPQAAVPMRTAAARRTAQVLFMPAIISNAAGGGKRAGPRAFLLPPPIGYNILQGPGGRPPASGREPTSE